MSEEETAAVSRLVADSEEIAGLILQNIVAALDCSGEPFTRTSYAFGLEPLLAAAWNLAKRAYEDEGQARLFNVEMLRRHADAVEGITRT